MGALASGSDVNRGTSAHRLVTTGKLSSAARLKDYRYGGGRVAETIAGDEFVRRFVLHILPPGFHRVRRRGFLGGPVRNERIAHIRSILGASEATPTGEVDHVETPTDEPAADEAETRTINCPHCGSKELIHLAELPRTFGYVVREPVQFNKGGAAGALAASPRPQLARPP